MMHPELNMMLAKLRSDELTSSSLHVDRRSRRRRRFFRRRRDTVATVVSRPADLVALPPPREGREVDTRHVA
jgi:hypothetical protein